MDYIAHIRQKDGKIQTVATHLREVQELCERFGEKIGARHLAGLAGLLHDLGKNTSVFKAYIEAAAANPNNPPRRGSVDHSTAGGMLLYRRYHRRRPPFRADELASEWIANCIISHHQGLRDFLDPQAESPFLDRVMNERLNDQFEEARDVFLKMMREAELDAYFAKAKKELVNLWKTIEKYKLSSLAASLVIKFIFSCLIDADRTNSRQFEEDEVPEPPFDSLPFFRRCYGALMNRIDEMENGPNAKHPINRLRSEMSRQCEAFALQRPSGIYTLSIPTGGGKTLASLRFAIQHAIATKKERIVYIVPYTTIIEQNAEDIRDILQEDEMILEHHSNVVEEVKEENEDYDVRQKKLKLARDSWDRPIIFTTMVQFLNTFYAKGTRNTRRMHQLANAVLIFDEVQSVPVKCISLFNTALNVLHRLGGSSVVLCTATQPALDFVKRNLQLSENPEMIANLPQVSEQFKRVELLDYTSSPLGWDSAKMAAFVGERLDDVRSVLVILNTKTAARKLFNQLEQGLAGRDVRLFHLSTNMCAAHRKVELKKLREALEAEERVVCVSTQLIEAGVDISFECVIRSLAGLDSIAQAAGRCNRHGKDAVRNVYIVRASDETLTHLPEIRIGAATTERVLREFRDTPERFGCDLLSKPAMTAYFQHYFYQLQNEMDYRVPKLDKNLADLLSTNKAIYESYEKKHGRKPEIESRAALATAEQHFEVIDNAATAVLVPYNAKADELILKLNGELDIRELSDLLRQAQQYVVNVYDHERRSLIKNGDIYPLLNGQVLALRPTAYSEKFGLEVSGEGEWSMAMI